MPDFIIDFLKSLLNYICFKNPPIPTLYIGAIIIFIIATFIFIVAVILLLWDRLISPLFDLKAHEIDSYKNLLDLFEKTNNLLKQDYKRLDLDKKQIQTEFEKAKSDINTQRQITKDLLMNFIAVQHGLIIFRQIILLYSLYTNTRTMLNIYLINRVESYYPDAPKGIDIFNQLDKIENNIQPLLSKADNLVISKADDISNKIIVPQEFKQFDYNSGSAELNQLLDMMTKYLDQYYKRST